MLLQIPFDESEGKENLIGIINSATTYRSRYGKAFVVPKRVGAYDEIIADNAKAAVREKMSAGSVPLEVGYQRPRFDVRVKFDGVP